MIDLELLPPFGYLQHVKEKVETAQQGEMKSDAHEGVACSDSVSLGDPIGLSGRKLLHLRRIAETVLKFVSLLYPASFLSTIERNQLIQARYAQGIGLSALAEQFGISPQRVYQIVHGKHH